MRRTLFGCVLAMAATAIGATGCLSRPAVVPRSYSIDPPARRSPSPSGGIVLSLPRVEVAPPYSGQSFVYRTGEHGLVRDPYAKFASPPGWLLTAAIRGYLANADFVRDVVSPGHGLRSEATVEVAVSEIAGELRPSGSSAVLTLTFRVFSNRDGAHPAVEILLKSYSSTLPISPATAQEAVRAWNQGLADIMGEFQTDLHASLVASSLLSSDSDLATGPSRRSSRE
jgi:uncharacterized lipoprotein YmbA